MIGVDNETARPALEYDVFVLHSVGHYVERIRRIFAPYRHEQHVVVGHRVFVARIVCCFAVAPPYKDARFFNDPVRCRKIEFFAE